jgi:hypothetical protein
MNIVNLSVILFIIIQLTYVLQVGIASDHGRCTEGIAVGSKESGVSYQLR